MYELVATLNEIGKELAKEYVDNNPYMNYYQKACAKAWIDGRCDYYTFLNRVEKYMLEYLFQEIVFYNSYCNYQPIYF